MGDGGNGPKPTESNGDRVRVRFAETNRSRHICSDSLRKILDRAATRSGREMRMFHARHDAAKSASRLRPFDLMRLAGGTSAFSRLWRVARSIENFPATNSNRYVGSVGLGESHAHGSPLLSRPASGPFATVSIPRARRATACSVP